LIEVILGSSPGNAGKSGTDESLCVSQVTEKWAGIFRMVSKIQVPIAPAKMDGAGKPRFHRVRLGLRKIATAWVAEFSVIIIRVHDYRQSIILEVRLADRALSLFSGLFKSRHENCHQHRQDGNYHQQLY